MSQSRPFCAIFRIMLKMTRFYVVFSPVYIERGLGQIRYFMGVWSYKPIINTPSVKTFILSKTSLYTNSGKNKHQSAQKHRTLRYLHKMRQFWGEIRIVAISHAVRQNLTDFQLFLSLTPWGSFLTENEIISLFLATRYSFRQNGYKSDV